MTQPLIEPTEFLRLINTTNHVALDKACLTISGKGMFCAKASIMSSLSMQLFRAMRETQDFQRALREYTDATKPNP